MPCGDGGMITTNDKSLYEKLVAMTWLGISSTYSRTQTKDGLTGKPGYSWDYEVDILGYKCYMIDLQAAICLEQMKKLPKHLSGEGMYKKDITMNWLDLSNHLHTVNCSVLLREG